MAFEDDQKLSHDPQHWQAQAEDARQVAVQILDPFSRRTMLHIAESYEDLAGRVAQELDSTGQPAIMPGPGQFFKTGLTRLR
jgi:hypothetical protein